MSEVQKVNETLSGGPSEEEKVIKSIEQRIKEMEKNPNTPPELLEATKQMLEMHLEETNILKEDSKSIEESHIEAKKELDEIRKITNQSMF